MLGLIFIILTYAVVTGVCVLIKSLKLKIKGDKGKTETPSTSRIYYVTNTAKKKKTTRKKPDVAIKGSLVEKIRDDE